MVRTMILNMVTTPSVVPPRDLGGVSRHHLQISGHVSPTVPSYKKGE